MFSYSFVKSEIPYYQEVILYYKTNPCPSIFNKQQYSLSSPQKACFQGSCFNFHTYEERRRPVFTEDTHEKTYNPYFCPAIQNQGNCQDADNCRFCHTSNELLYHPANYKVEECQGCTFESNPKLCSKLHSDETSRKITHERFTTKKGKDYPTNDHESQVEFSLDQFKTQPCQVKGHHNPKFCYYYHYENRDRRRATSQFNYSPDLCAQVEKHQECRLGDKCGYAHNKVEQLYHPDRYKKKFCLFHPHKIEKCEYKHFCSFAHSETEIKIELLHNIKQDENFYLYKYKTVFCPYIYEHDRSQCVYAHNPQDFRRNPLIYKYNPVQCPEWSQEQIFNYEQGRCSKGMNCEMSHGWKEMEFHPHYFKTKMCSNSHKCTKKDCPFYHNNDKRTGKQPLLNASSDSYQPLNFFTPVKHTTVKPEEEFKANSEPVPKKKTNTRKNEKGKVNRNLNEMNYEQPPLSTPLNLQGSKSSSLESGSSSGSDDQNKRQEFKFKSSNSNSSYSNGFSNMFLKKQFNSERSDPILSIGSSNTENNNKHFYLHSEQIWGMNFKSDKYDQSSWDNFNIRGKENSLIKNESNESLKNMSPRQLSIGSERNGVPAEKPSVREEQIKVNLAKKLESKGFHYAVPILTGRNVDKECLKQLASRDFSKLGQIKENDQPKIATIVQDLLEDENLMAEITIMMNQDDKIDHQENKSTSGLLEALNFTSQ